MTCPLSACRPQFWFPDGPDFRSDQTGWRSHALFRPLAGSLIPAGPRTPSVMPAAHVSRVRALYRRILLLHRVLPPDLKALGDRYVKDEFRRHKMVGSDEARRFMQEWEASECPPLSPPSYTLGGPSEVSRFVPMKDRLSRLVFPGPTPAAACSM